MFGFSGLTIYRYVIDIATLECTPLDMPTVNQYIIGSLITIVSGIPFLIYADHNIPKAYSLNLNTLEQAECTTSTNTSATRVDINGTIEFSSGLVGFLFNNDLSVISVGKDYINETFYDTNSDATLDLWDTADNGGIAQIPIHKLVLGEPPIVVNKNYKLYADGVEITGVQ